MGVPKPKRISAKPHKDLKPILDHAEKDHGWRVEDTEKGWMCKAPQEDIQPGKKGMALTHATPGDWRALKEFQRDLKLEGGLMPKAKCEKCNPKEKAKDAHDPVDCLTSKGHPAEDVVNLQGDDLTEFHDLYHDEHGVA